MANAQIDVHRLYTVLDKDRLERGISWRTLADSLGVSPSTFTRMRDGSKPDADTFATILDWLEQPAGRFLRGTRGRRRSKRQTKRAVKTEISVILHTSLEPAEAEAVDRVVRAVLTP